MAITAPLGSLERTKQLLASASKRTGVAVPKQFQLSKGAPSPKASRGSLEDLAGRAGGTTFTNSRGGTQIRVGNTIMNPKTFEFFFNRGDFGDLGSAPSAGEPRFVAPQGRAQQARQFGAEPGVSGSIIDLLKGKGIDSSFGFRSKLFAQLGGQGEFVGSAEQNLGSLGTLDRLEKQAGISLTARNLQDIIKGFGVNLSPRFGPGEQPGTTVAGGAPSIPTGGDLSGLAATAAGGGLPDPDEIGAQAALDFLGSGEFDLAKFESDARKSLLNIQQEREMQTLLQDFAQRGLAFSGIREKGEATAEEVQRLAQVLQIEVPLAKVVAKGIAEQTQDLLKDALDEKQDAIDFFKSIGLVVNPETGQLVQTAAETRAQASAERAAEPDVLSVAEAARFGVPFGTTEAQVKGIVPPKTTEEFTRGDKNALAFAEITSRAAPALIDSIGTDGNVDPRVFAKFFQEVAEKVPTKIDDFKLQFGPLLNPEDAAQFGISPSDLDPFDALLRRARGDS